MIKYNFITHAQDRGFSQEEKQMPIALTQYLQSLPNASFTLKTLPQMSIQLYSTMLRSVSLLPTFLNHTSYIQILASEFLLLQILDSCVQKQFIRDRNSSRRKCQMRNLRIISFASNCMNLKFKFSTPEFMVLERMFYFRREKLLQCDGAFLNCLFPFWEI